MRLLPHSLRSRLLLLALLPLLALALALGIRSVDTALEGEVRALDERGRGLATGLALSAELPLFAGDVEALQELATRYLKVPGCVGIEIRDAGGQPLLVQGVLSSSGTSGGGAAGREQVKLFSAPVHLSGIRFADTIEQMGGEEEQARPAELLGEVVIALSTEQMRLQQHRTLRDSIALSLGTLVFATLLALLMARRLTTPLARVTATVRALQEGDLSARVPLSGSGELRRLEEGINALAETVERSQERLRSEVDQATSRLREALGELEQRNRELESARSRAEQASEAKDLFLAQMSHELRTPLTSIIGFARMLETLPPGPQREEAISVIRRASGLLLTVIDDILGFTKLQAGAVRLEQTGFVLRDCIEDVMTLLGPSAADKQLDLGLLIEPDVPPRVTGDPGRLAQILTNLLNNAIRFTEKGEIRIDVRVLEEEEAGVRLLFCVSDTGIGVDPELREALFEPFTQADGSIARRHGGTGLGLAICRQLIELMGGEVRLDSSPGRGTRVSFTLPLSCPASRRPVTEIPLPAGMALGLYGPPTLSRQVLRSLLLGEGRSLHLLERHEDLERWLARIGDRPALLALVPGPGQERDGECEVQLRELRGRFEGPVLLVCSRPERCPPGMERRWAPMGLLRTPVTARGLAQALASLLESQVTRPPGDTCRQPAPSGDLRLLLVEDNAFNRLYLGRLLALHRIDVKMAADAAEALRLSGRESFDLVLMDLHLPGMDGLECLRRLREKGARMPVIALTADLAAAEGDTLQQAGFDGVLLKPVDEEALLALLARHGAGTGAVGRADPFEGVPMHLLPALREELQRLFDGLSRALEEGDRGRAWDLAHQLSGLAGLYRLVPLRARVAELEECCRDGRLVEAGKLLGEIRGLAREAGFTATG